MSYSSRQAGIFNALLIPVIVLALISASVGVFAVKEYQNANNYKNNVDAIAQSDVNAALAQQQTKLQAQFAQEAKLPNQKFTAPEQFGSLSVMYPKTWSVYVSDDGSSSGQFSAYFDPSEVPPTQNGTPNALRISIVTQDYSQVLQTYQSQVQQGTLTSTPVLLAHGVAGLRLTGQLTQTTNGSMIIFPLRATTAEVFTESPSFLPDFNNTIVPSLTFNP
jgi:hypothetical protein